MNFHTKYNTRFSLPLRRWNAFVSHPQINHIRSTWSHLLSAISTHSVYISIEIMLSSQVYLLLNCADDMTPRAILLSQHLNRRFMCRTHTFWEPFSFSMLIYTLFSGSRLRNTVKLASMKCDAIDIFMGFLFVRCTTEKNENPLRKNERR